MKLVFGTEVFNKNAGINYHSKDFHDFNPLVFFLSASKSWEDQMDTLSILFFQAFKEVVVFFFALEIIKSAKSVISF